jgi:hypothetical protein
MSEAGAAGNATQAPSPHLRRRDRRQPRQAQWIHDPVVAAGRRPDRAGSCLDRSAYRHPRPIRTGIDAGAAGHAAGQGRGGRSGSGCGSSKARGYIEPSSVLTATPTTITIANHTRYYPQPSGDPISVSVTGGTVSATGSGDTDYVSYSDPMRAGGSVTYIVSTDAPTQTGDTHVVGAVLIPDTGTADGGDGPRRPGFVQAKEIPTQQTDRLSERPCRTSGNARLRALVPLIGSC